MVQRILKSRAATVVLYAAFAIAMLTYVAMMAVALTVVISRDFVRRGGTILAMTLRQAHTAIKHRLSSRAGSGS